jgi:NADH-quinone oxidoreductase subunit H
LRQLRRSAEIHAEGADRSGGLQQGRVFAGPAGLRTSALAAWAVIPVSEGWAVADINVGILYIFADRFVGVDGVIMAGWASN